MIKVLRIINRFNIGGPTYNATFLTRFLGEEFETLLIGGLPEDGEADSLHIPNHYGIEPMILEEMKRKPNILSDRKAYLKIKEIIQTYQPDIVHTHASKAGVLGRKAAFACNVPIVLHTFHGHVFHSYFGKLKTKLYKKIERNLAKKSTGIIAISELQKKELASIHHICNSEKIKVIPLGFDLDKFRIDLPSKRLKTRTEYNLSEEKVAVAIIGRLAPIKDHDFFLNVVEHVLAQKITNAQFFIVGDGELRQEIIQRIEKINNQYPNSIVFTSWIKDIASFNAGMDVICLTSKNEGTPVSLIEAQACGVPVLSTNVGGVKDIVDEGKTGYIIEVNDLENYTKQLTKLIQEKNIREKMSQNGWNFVREKFHYTRLANDMEIYYKELLNNYENSKK